MVMREMHRVLKLMKSKPSYAKFEKEILAHLSWYVGQGDLRLKINTKQDIKDLYRILGGVK